MRFWVPAMIAFAVAGAAPAPAAEPPITIVAAENFYGEIAHRIAGPHATVVSLISSPDQDPHLFETNTAAAQAVSRARIVIANGADYDPWLEKLLRASHGERRVEIVAASLTGKKAGDNPHLWYDPATMRAVAGGLVSALSAADPSDRSEFEQNEKAFVESLRPLEAKIADVKKRHVGSPVTASEPVFGYMAQALGLAMRNQEFQTAVMNDTEPSPAEIAAFEDDLRQHRVKAMLYNSQAEDAAVKRLVSIAESAHIPVVGVTETEPGGKTYEDWMTEQLDRLDAALTGDHS